MVYSPAEGKKVPCDGQGMLRLASGRVLLLGGAPGGHGPESVNAIWASDDDCVTWTEILAAGAASATRPAGGHTLGFLNPTFGGVEYVYWIGGDPFAPTGNVFRILASELDVGGNPNAAWTLMTTTCPTSALVLFMYGQLAPDGDLFIIGGQTSIANGSPASKKVFKSSNQGTTWTEVGTNIVPADVWGAQLGPLPVLDGKFWVCGSARYDDTPDYTNFSNAVYTFDGTNWVEVLPDGHAEFLPHRYHSVVPYKGRLLMFNGTTWDGATLESDTRSVHSTSDGVTWDEWPSGTPTDLPWGSTHAQAAVVLPSGPALTEGFQSACVYRIEEQEGPLLDTLLDLGTQGENLAQATSGNKPILDPAGFATTPGIAFSRGQRMMLASPKRGLANSVYVACFIGRTRSFDGSTATVPDSPCTFFGMSDGSAWNALGLTTDPMTIIDATNTTPIVVEIDAPHRLRTGDRVSIHGVQGNRAAIGDWVVTVTSSTTFSLNGSAGSGAYTSAGTARVARAKYAYFDGGLQDIVGGSWLDDGKKHVIAVVHTATAVALWVDGTKVAEQAANFDTTWIGFDTLGAGVAGADAGQFILGAGFVLTDLLSAPPDSFWAKVQTFAALYA